MSERIFLRLGPNGALGGSLLRGCSLLGGPLAQGWIGGAGGFGWAGAPGAGFLRRRAGSALSGHLPAAPVRDLGARRERKHASAAATKSAHILKAHYEAMVP